MARNVVVFMVLLFASLSTAITLTPVWEITRPEEWADIKGIGIHLDGSGDPFVVCTTDSGAFGVDYTGAVSTICELTKESQEYQDLYGSSNGRYLGICTWRVVGDTNTCDMRVIEADGSLVWEVTDTPYGRISLADEGPWSVSSIVHLGEYSSVFENILIRDPMGGVINEVLLSVYFGVSITKDADRVFCGVGDSVRCFDNQGNLLWTRPEPPPGMEAYWGANGCGTPSDSVVAILYNLGASESGKVVFWDHNGVPSAGVDVAGGYGDLEISADGEYVAAGVFGTFYLIQRTPPSVVWSVTDPAGHRARWYRSVAISDDASLVVGAVSRSDSVISRLEIYGTSGTTLLNEQYPTVGTISVEMMGDGSYLAVKKQQLTALTPDETLTLYAITP